MNITVYLGANAGNDPKLQEAVEALGKWIGENGHDLIYGGSKCGLMGSKVLYLFACRLLQPVCRSEHQGSHCQVALRRPENRGDFC